MAYWFFFLFYTQVSRLNQIWIDLKERKKRNTSLGNNKLKRKFKPRGMKNEHETVHFILCFYLYEI